MQICQCRWGITECDYFRKGIRNLEFYMGNKDLSRKVEFYIRNWKPSKNLSFVKQSTCPSQSQVTSQHLLESYKCP